MSCTDEVFGKDRVLMSRGAVPGFGAHLCRTRPARRNVRPVEELLTAGGLGGLQPFRA